jgi:hypothetical protein
VDKNDSFLSHSSLCHACLDAWASEGRTAREGINATGHHITSPCLADNASEAIERACFVNPPIVESLAQLIKADDPVPADRLDYQSSHESVDISFSRSHHIQESIAIRTRINSDQAGLHYHLNHEPVNIAFSRSHQIRKPNSHSKLQVRSHHEVWIKRRPTT